MGNNTSTHASVEDNSGGCFDAIDDTNQGGRQQQRGSKRPAGQCAYCTRQERLMSFYDLRPGHHISMGGEHLKMNLGDKQIKWYTHHAIVKRVENVSKSSAIVTLMHFNDSPFSEQKTLHKIKKLMCLRFDEIFIEQYRQKTYSAEEIISRAEELVDDAEANGNYWLMFNNCEHFCHYCCVGSKESNQVNKIFGKIERFLSENVGMTPVVLRAVKNILKVLGLSLDDIPEVIAKNVHYQRLGLASCLLSLVFFCVGLLYCICRHCNLNKLSKENQLCSNCCTRMKKELWMSFFLISVVQLSGLGLLCIPVVASAPIIVKVSIPIGIGILTLSSVEVIEALKSKFQSPFDGELVKVEALEDVSKGDILSLKNLLHWHEVIVSDVSRPEHGEVTVIHYSRSGLMKSDKCVVENVNNDLTRKGYRWHVVEETIKIDPKRTSVFKLDYTNYRTYKRDEVVERGRQRIGETKYNIVSNRSCHLCHWAKVMEETKECDDTFLQEDHVFVFQKHIESMEGISKDNVCSVDQRRERKQSTKPLVTKCGRIREDIEKGQIISFKRKGFWHTVTTTSVTFETAPSKLTTTFVHYGEENTVCEDSQTFDLNYDDIVLYKYHPVHRFNKEDVVCRAKTRIGEKRTNVFTRRSSHLADEIVVKRPSRVGSIDILKPGDAIIIQYWSLPHDVVVTGVENCHAKDNSKGIVTIVHYALQSIFDKRTIVEEKIHVDLRNDIVHLKDYSGQITYPDEMVVQRARSRVGEQRFSVASNRSRDFVHWVKVVQKPAMVRSPTGKEYLFVQELVQRTDGNLQHQPAYSWEDLQPGTIITLREGWAWHHSIITESNKESNSVKMVQFRRNLFENIIAKVERAIDLHHQNVWICIADPTKSRKPEDVVRIAENMLENQLDLKRYKRSLDFCKECVLTSESDKKAEKDGNN